MNKRHFILSEIDSKGLYQEETAKGVFSLFKTPGTRATVYSIILSDITRKKFFREDGLTIDVCMEVMENIN